YTLPFISLLSVALAPSLHLFPTRRSSDLEKITGGNWPAKEVRHRRLEESVQVMKRLWTGESVTYSGHIEVENATLYTKPKSPPLDRKSTRLNSSHVKISYAVFCLQKKR